MNEQEIAWMLVKGAEAEDYFTKLLRDPKAAAKDLGLSMTDKEADVIRKYVAGMRRRAETGEKIFVYPLPKVSGTPVGGAKPVKPPKGQKMFVYPLPKVAGVPKGTPKPPKPNN